MPAFIINVLTRVTSPPGWRGVIRRQLVKQFGFNAARSSWTGAPLPYASPPICHPWERRRPRPLLW
jgi:hypothetical protein